MHALNPFEEKPWNWISAVFYDIPTQPMVGLLDSCCEKSFVFFKQFDSDCLHCSDSNEFLPM